VVFYPHHQSSVLFRCTRRKGKECGCDRRHLKRGNRTWTAFPLEGRRLTVSFILSLCCFPGRAIAEAVSRWLPTAAARVRARIWTSGICGGQSGAGVGFLRVLRFPLPIFIPPNSPSS
jgi:hypothetical protein